MYNGRLPFIESMSLQLGFFLGKCSRAKRMQEEPVDPAKEEESPSKKRKVSVSHEDPPNIIKLVVTESQTHVIVVTGEDKCIRVFEISESGDLQQLSQRLAVPMYCSVPSNPNQKHAKTAMCSHNLPRRHEHHLW
jgi:hypothetical protein